jgi:hypothetical protein
MVEGVPFGGTGGLYVLSGGIFVRLLTGPVGRPYPPLDILWQHHSSDGSNPNISGLLPPGIPANGSDVYCPFVFSTEYDRQAIAFPCCQRSVPNPKSQFPATTCQHDAGDGIPKSGSNLGDAEFLQVQPHGHPVHGIVLNPA